MSFFDDASLVMIPSGYKDQKVYSVKPTDGTGDLTFSRASSATRVASNGLIEKVRTNLVLQSQAFNTTWAVNAAPTITANTTVAPDGTTTADTIAATASFSGVYQSPINVSNGVEHSWSVYIKNISSASNIYLGIASNPSNASLNYNATSGTIISSGAGLAASSATNVGNGWYRLSGTYVSTGTTHDFVIYGMGTMSFAVWGAQLETGVTTAYIATTTAAVSVGPVSGLPRLDYLGSTCPRLLLEPQRSNALLQSENLSSATWTKDGGSVTANAIASPDGSTNADLFTENTSTGNHRVYGSAVTTSANQPLTFSVFAKYNGRQYVYLRADVIVPKTAVFDIQNGTTGEVSSESSSKIENYGNGWYRLTFTVNALVGNTAICDGLVGLLNGNSYANNSYTGNGTAGAYLWGFQVELDSAYATSYIPTLGASVTRVADAASKTGISSLIGQTEGTLFGEIKITAFDPNGFIPILLKNAAGNIETYVWFQQDGRVRGFVYNLAQQADINTSAGFAVIGGTYKFALAYKQNDFAFYINGQQIGTDNSGTVGAMTQYHLTYDGLTGYSHPINLKQALLFTTRLSNAQLAELTA
jgi:hypothetical protein